MPNLLLTNVVGASCLDTLQRLQVRTIVNCSDEAYTFGDRFAYLRVELKDESSTDLKPHWERVLPFMRAAISPNAEKSETKHAGDQHGTLLIYCTAGVSRSASFVLAYLIKYHGMSYRQALAHVRARRQCVQPNEGFERQLIDFEAIRPQTRESGGTRDEKDPAAATLKN